MRQPIVESTPGQEAMTQRIQRTFDGLHQDVSGLSASDIAYTPSNSSNWVSPAPTTLQQALDRLAAAGGTTPVP